MQLNTLHAAEQNGAISRIRGKSTWRFTFRKFSPALKEEQQCDTAHKCLSINSHNTRSR